MSQGAAIERSKSRLKNRNIDVYGKEVLRLAEKFKKGWFAIDVASCMTDDFEIPEYINQSLFFLNNEISDSLLVKMAEHRLERHADDNGELLFLLESVDFTEFPNLDEIVNSYRDLFGDDLVTLIFEHKFNLE